LFFAEFDYFESLTNRIISVWLALDSEFGWIIYLDSYGRGEFTSSFFPAQESSVSIEIGGKQVLFIISNRGRWFLYSPNSRAILGDWLEKYVDEEKLLKENELMSSKHNIPFEIPAFLRIAKPKEEYSIMPAIYLYPEKMRRNTNRT